MTIDEDTKKNIHEFFSQNGRDQRDKDKWLQNFSSILTCLQKTTGKIDKLTEIITADWVGKIYDWLKKQNNSRGCSTSETVKAIGAGNVYSLEYFYHEVIEYRYLENKDLLKPDAWSNERGKTEKHKSHGYALKAEYELLRELASLLKYEISFGAMFDNHPFFNEAVRKETKDNDKKRLKEMKEELKVELAYEDREKQKVGEFFEKLKEIANSRNS